MNNIAFLYSNDHSHSCEIGKIVCEQIGIKTYIVENRAAELLSEEGPLKDRIIREFGKESYKNGKFNPIIVEGLDFSTSPEISWLQEMMNDIIINELKKRKDNVLVITNQLIETGLLHLSDNLIVCRFFNQIEYDEYVNIDSIRNICAYYIEPGDIKYMTDTLRGCLIDCWGYS